MANSIMLDKAKALAISIVKICRSIKETCNSPIDLFIYLFIFYYSVFLTENA